ncbi:tetratricopeptide repeat protein [Actinacidiphila glaucinigra]|uniref:tetratricopeptide repeat protein n=1 Tax=Actinacidiphila glaucinigra TaxID=235986 RepID=UPI0036CA675C
MPHQRVAQPAAQAGEPRRVNVNGGVGAGGDIKASALGPNSSVTIIEKYVVKEASADAAEVSWPVVVGSVPVLASAFQPRTSLRERIDEARSRSGKTVVLTQVLSGGGGVGKSQLAAAYATDAFESGSDVVMWVTATDVQQVIALYAQAAARVKAPGADGQDLEADANAFLTWLSITTRRWMVVLDDIKDPAAMGPWWPTSRTGTGWTLATTRLHDSRLTGGGRTRVDIGVYTPTEAGTYLDTRLANDGMAHLFDDHARALAETLGHLPLALGHAAAYMINEDIPCGTYLDRFNDRKNRLDQVLPDSADTEGYGRQITATLLLSLDAAQSAEPAGLAAPALRLAALVDPAGHPHALWTTPAARAYLSIHRASTIPLSGAQREPTPTVTAEQIHSVLRTLHRYALLTCNTRAEPRAVRIHALTARAVRETTPIPDLFGLAIVAADALLQIWPDPDQPHRDLAATLRTNTDTLAGHAHDHQWHLEGHPVLYRAGQSLLDAGLLASAITYWQNLTARSEQSLGGDHPSTLTARSNLAASYWQAGRTEEAIAIAEQVFADRKRILGDEHPDTLTARANIAVSYRDAGRIDEAITLLEQVLADHQRILGDEHPNTLTTRAKLAFSYWQAGRTDEAIGIEEQVLADRQRILGDEHPDTLTARGNLAVSYRQAGRTDEAITLLKQVLADRQRILGDEHPSTLTARASLAVSYQQARRTDEAITLLKQVLADRQRILGDEHPDTLTTRANIAVSHRQAGRTDEAITLLKQVLADHQRILGDEHPSTLTTRANLAGSYHQAGRTGEAITLLEQVLADHQRILGDEHPDTLATRGNLAASYHQAGRAEEAIGIEEQVLADHQRILGDEHPDTLTARGNLAVSYHQAGRTDEAITLLEHVLADHQRILGDEHPDTLATRGNLAGSYHQAGRTGEAITLLEHVLADHQRIHGDEHPDSVTLRRALMGWVPEPGAE